MISRDLNEKIDQFIDAHRDQMCEDICELVRIRSVATDGKEFPPFGIGCRDALDKALEISQRLGFDTDNCDYYCGSASLKENDDKPHIGFWGHLDVVPEGEGWHFPPYEPKLYDGYIVGRGTSDNKGAIICSLYTLLFFKENYFDLRYNYKVIFGTDEERGMNDVDYYLQKRTSPVFSVIADSVFPICYAEKGIFRGEIRIPTPPGFIQELSGGVVANAVPSEARCTVKKSDFVIASLPKEIKVIDQEEDIEIVATGKGAHAASPENSINAIHLLASYLASGYKDPSVKGVFNLIANISATYNGEAFGIECSDEVSGELTCVIGTISIENDIVSLSMDIRYPISTDSAEMIDLISKRCSKAGVDINVLRNSKPYYVDPESELVVLLNDLYNQFMGSSVPPYYEGGGSYARKIPNSLAFGPILHSRKSKPDVLVHGGAHKNDESICIDELMVALKIYIISVLKLDGLDFE